MSCLRCHSVRFVVLFCKGSNFSSLCRLRTRSAGCDGLVCAIVIKNDEAICQNRPIVVGVIEFY